MDEEDIVAWCDDILPELYNPGLFDDEETTDDVWAAVGKEVSSYVESLGLESSDALSDALLDAAGDWFRSYRDVEIEGLTAVDPEVIGAILSKPQTPQHSADWYSQRRNRLTASEFSQILTGSRGRLQRSKVAEAAGDRPSQAPVSLASGDGDMVATSWGHRYEPIVREIYEQELAGVGTVCDSLGRFTHADYEWLSASPDGLVTTGPLAGRLLEIKAPKTRQPGTYVPFDYYVQMQVQMEVCNLDAVDFVEAQIGQYVLDGVYADSTLEPVVIPKGTKWMGLLAVYGNLDDPGSWVYRYSKAVEDIEDACLPEPATDSNGNPLPLLESTIWWLKGWYPRTVLRNQEWWSSIGKPAAELFWAEVLSLRELPPEPVTEVEVKWLGT